MSGIAEGNPQLPGDNLDAFVATLPGLGWCLGDRGAGGSRRRSQITPSLKKLTVSV